jgi:hypothetical protein
MEKELLVVDVETAFPDAAKCRHRSVHRVPLDDGCRACGERGFMGIRILARATVAPCAGARIETLRLERQ